MSARLVVAIVPDTEVENIEAILARHCRRFWREAVPGGLEKFSCLVQLRYTERLLEELEANFAETPGFTAYVEQLEAILPPLEETPETELPGSDTPPPTALERFFTRDRVSTDELYDDIAESLQPRPSYLLTVILSSVIAGLGMRSGQTAVVIGAMIIAPLLGPTMGIALAATVGNGELGRKAAMTLVIGSLLAILAGVAVGMLVEIDPLIPELRNRTLVQPADIALALACGAAGVLAFSRAASLTLVGVMIAVALVPPLAACGIYFGAGFPVASGNALFLFAINLVCVNVAGIAMFLFQGLPPKSWRMTGGILALWVFVLLLLASMMAGRLVLGLGTVEMVAEAIANRM
ncbi:TIGR00341 family protein [Alteraurantiacibacter aquimixticola]|uniref:TIGR00341 family protein n=1 Tax=Alteraurantiacibacter aquimixticola TaxID=2489173 RepID=A0A4V4U8F6_9SPHN|nr:TIGR00341 family protein [Alteraurantiacibacter aquimixticola]TIX49760.1 TIGR00341 family protein [Alteraurantiacibacter aquimixticola]